ncbi:MAG: hypothetical protein LBR53_01940 [Deltaproteobacteria bacterium]|nr:hypothetical protein [Deltaproteobacteria bacterium]
MGFAPLRREMNSEAGCSARGRERMKKPERVSAGSLYSSKFNDFTDEIYKVNSINMYSDELNKD